MIPDLRPYIDIGAGGLLTLVVLLVLTDRLIRRGRLTELQADYEQRLEKVEKDRDEWKDMALRSLGITERMTRPVEVVADVMTRLPDPAAEEAKP